MIVVHKIENCPLCDKCIKLLKHWHIKYRVVYDIAQQDRPHPYITIEYGYKELIQMITEGRIR